MRNNMKTMYIMLLALLLISEYACKRVQYSENRTNTKERAKIMDNQPQRQNVYVKLATVLLKNKDRVYHALHKEGIESLMFEDLGAVRIDVHMNDYKRALDIIKTDARIHHYKIID